MIDPAFAEALTGTTSDWVDALPGYQAKLIEQMLAGGDDLLGVSEAWLSTRGPTSTESFGAGRTAKNAFLDSLLTQLCSLLCGTDAALASERTELIRNAKAGRTALIAATSTLLAGHLGISAILLAAPIALIYAILARAGSDSVCATLEQLIEDRKKKQ
jgi:hypothetical protein